MYESGKLIHKLLGEPPVSELPADYVIEASGKMWGIERKTASGFLGDFASGRLMEQLKLMRGLFEDVFLIIEGLWMLSSDGKVSVQFGEPKRRGNALIVLLRDTEWNYKAVVGFLTSITSKLVREVKFTLSPRETAEVIKELDSLLSRR